MSTNQHTAGPTQKEIIDELVAALKDAYEELHGYADAGGSNKAEHICGQIRAALAKAESK